MSNIFDLEPEMQELIRRFEDALNSKSIQYFDVDDLESIIDCYIAMEDNAKARKAMEYAYRIHPDSKQLKCKDAKILLCEGHYRAAADLLSSIQDLEPDYVAILAESNLRMKHFDTARDLFTNYLMQCNPSELDQIFVDIATLFNTYKKPEYALDFLDNAVTLFPENKDILIERAFALEQMLKYDEAIDTFKKVLAIDPYSAEVWSLLGSMYFAKKEFTKAIHAYDYALAIHPNDLNTKLQRAHCLFNTARFSEAVEPYTEYLKENPQDPLVTTFLAETYENLDDIDNAELLYKRVIDLNSEIYEAWLGLASCYQNTNRIELAYETIRDADKIIPDNLHIVYLMSRIENDMAELKDDDKYMRDALNHLIFCINCDPENNIFIFEAASLYLQFANYKSAKQLFELAYKRDPYIENITIFMAMTYYALGEYDKCMAFYKKAKETISNAKAIFLSLFPEAGNIIN